jgi:hypothetical protein
VSQPAGARPQLRARSSALRRYAAEGDDERAYVFLQRFICVAARVLPLHNGYMLKAYTAERLENARRHEVRPTLRSAQRCPAEAVECTAPRKPWRKRRS